MKKRVFSGMVMCFLVFPLIFIGGISFQLFVSFVSVFALKEILDLKKHHAVIPQGMKVVAYLGLVYLVFPFSKIEWIVTGFNIQKVSFLLLVFFVPCLFYKKKEYTTKDAFYLSGSIFFLGLAFHTLIRIREENMLSLFYVGFIPVLSDIFAMLIGKWIGRHPCALAISPNKTWEGSIGGAFVSILLCSFFYFRWIGDLSLFLIFIFTTIMVIMGQLGDLFFSKIKRENDKKDFSQILPGHGGFLDRLDSLLFVILTYTVLFNVY